jgi:butyryl-CoA dehydrogenase
MIADMATELDAARLLFYRAASCIDNGRPYSTEGAMAKLYASETATRVVGKAIQIHGGYGYTESYRWSGTGVTLRQPRSTRGLPKCSAWS